MQCCCDVWAGFPNCYLEILDKLQKQICWTVGSSLAASLKPLAHCRNVVTLSLFYKHYFDRCSSELAQLAPLTYSQGRSARCSDISVTIPRCYKDAYIKSYRYHTERLSNSLPIKCFSLTYDLNSIKSRIKRHLLPICSL